jgi:hypothetical protein
MRKFKIVVLISVLTGLLISGSQAQSLGDAAREQRQKKSSKTTTTPPKVISNDDIASPDSSVAHTSAPAASAPSASSPSGPKISSAAPEVPMKPPSSDDAGSYDEWAKAGKEWKARILDQKTKIQSMQSYIDKLRSSVHFAAKNPDYDATVINRHELQKVDEAKRLEKQLDEENSTLQNLQEAVRAAGYDSSIYNPQQETGTSAPPASSPQN